MSVVNLGGNVFPSVANVKVGQTVRRYVPEPCDRDALLELADKMSRYASLRKRHGMDVDTMTVRAWVPRIREACGEVDGR